MCHPEIPAGQETPVVAQEEVEIALSTGERLPALLTHPEGSSVSPAIVVVPDILGRSPFYENLAARIATAGYRALLPDTFFRQGPLPELTMEAGRERREKVDEHRTIQDYLEAMDWLKARSDVDGERIGTVGFCMGGTLVLDLAAERSDLATVAYYGFPSGKSNALKPAPAPLDLVDRMKGPIIAFWGDQDTGVGMDNVQAFTDAMKKRGADFSHTIYEGLGHGFLSRSQFDPDHEAYLKACDSWTQAIAFYRRNLGARTAALA